MATWNKHLQYDWLCMFMLGGMQCVCMYTPFNEVLLKVVLLDCGCFHEVLLEIRGIESEEEGLGNSYVGSSAAQKLI